jgi:hypothetical protein
MPRWWQASTNRCSAADRRTGRGPHTGRPRRSPIPTAGERGERHQLDDVDAEVDEVVEPAGRGVERAAGGERAHVQLVEDAAERSGPSARAGPAAVAPAYTVASKIRLGPCTPRGCHGLRGSGSGGPPSTRKA